MANSSIKTDILRADAGFSWRECKGRLVLRRDVLPISHKTVLKLNFFTYMAATYH